MRYKIVKVTEKNYELIIRLKALFPRSLFKIRGMFILSKSDRGIFLTRKLSLGTGMPLLGKLIDKLTIFLGKKYIEEIKEHEKRDLEQFRRYIEERYN